MRLLEHAVDEWLKERGTLLAVCSASDLRSVVDGLPNVSRNELANAVTHRLWLIGRSRSDRESEATAAGLCHLDAANAS